MRKIIQIIKKDMRLLLRSKVSSLIVIFGPLLIMFLVGAAFDTSDQYALNIAVYSDQYTDTTESFINKLEEKKYNVDKLESSDFCVENVKQGNYHICIVFPAGLEVGGETNEVTFYADYSRINMVWVVLESLSSRLSARSKEISTDLTETLLKKLQETSLEVSDDLVKVKGIGEGDKSVNAIYDNIESMRIKLKETGLQEMADANKELQTSYLDYRGDTESRLEAIGSKLDKIKDDIEGVDNESEEEIMNSIESAEGNIDVMLYNLNKSSVLTNETYDMNRVLIIKLQRNINNVNSLISLSKEKMGNVKQIVSELDASLTKIHENLGGVQIQDAEKITAPITTKIQPVVSEQSNLDYVFSSLLVLVIMFISILLSTTIVMMEKTSPSYFRNFITPTNNFIFVFSSFLTSLLIVLVQAVIILGISAVFFKAGLSLYNIHTVCLLVLLVSSLFILIGMFIGYTFNSQETATLASISIGSIFLLLSNVILPLESMPAVMREIAGFNPFVLAEAALRKALLFNAGVTWLYSELLVLIGYVAVFVIFIWISQALIRKEFLYKIMGKRKK